MDSNFKMGRTFDQSTIDSTGAFLISQLEALDRTMHEPLASFTYMRDIDFRTDISIGQEITSYTVLNYTAAGGVDFNNKSFIGLNSTNLPEVSVDQGKVTSPLIPWGQKLSFSVFELEASMETGQDISTLKHNALMRKYHQDIDTQVYLGDSTIVMPNTTTPAYGLFNNPNMTNSQSVATGVGGYLWTQKTPNEILTDVNSFLTSIWQATALAKMPNRLLVSPLAFSYLNTTIVSSAGFCSLLTYLLNNNMATAQGEKLEIAPVKWLAGTNNGNTAGLQATDAMYAYRKDYDVARFPLVPIIGAPVQYRELSQIRPYYAKLGVVESVYVEATGYRYGIY